VIVACGRNVGPGRINRFRDSLLRQTFNKWGAILIDDASDDGSDEVLRRAFADEKERITLIHRRRRVGALANLVMAVKFFIERPDAVVVLVDLDDALGTQDALEKIARAYEQGADATIGTMIRTDKQADYPVDFHDPRANRGGNVWQHLRTFRRYLFDRIDVADLQIDGAWIELASDWAFMLPIVEMAENPIWIRTPLYLHEPGEERDPEHRTKRERVISTLVSRPRYARLSQRRLESEEKS
jgi:glycosyltransferase involved in cell wall biosynthesis